MRVTSTTNYIPGRCGYCGGDPPGAICSGLLTAATCCAERFSAGNFGSFSSFGACSATTLSQGNQLYFTFIKPTNKAKVERNRVYLLREIAVDWLMPGLPMLGLLRQPIRFGTMRSLISYKAPEKHGCGGTVSWEAARACRSAVFTRSNKLYVSLIITINRMHESTRHLTTEEITPVHCAIRTESGRFGKFCHLAP
jgi:hypothetical protein